MSAMQASTSSTICGSLSSSGLLVFRSSGIRYKCEPYTTAICENNEPKICKEDCFHYCPQCSQLTQRRRRRSIKDSKRKSEVHRNHRNHPQTLDEYKIERQFKALQRRLMIVYDQDRYSESQRNSKQTFSQLIKEEVMAIPKSTLIFAGLFFMAVTVIIFLMNRLPS